MTEIIQETPDVAEGPTALTAEQREANRIFQANRQAALDKAANFAGYPTWRLAETAVRNGEAVLAKIKEPQPKRGRRKASTKASHKQ